MMAATTVRDEPSMEEILASIRKIISEQEPESAAPQPQQATQAQQPKPAAPAPVAAATDEVLELTTVLNDDGTITDLASMGEDMIVDDFDSLVAEAVAEEAEDHTQATMAAALEDVAADLADFSDIAPEFAAGASEFGDENFAADLEPEAVLPHDTMALAMAEEAPAPVAFTPEPAIAMDSLTETLAPAVSEAVQTSILSSHAVDRSLSALSELRNAMHATASQPTGPSVTLEDLTKELLRPMLKGWLDANLPPLVERIVKEEIRRITGQGL